MSEKQWDICKIGGRYLLSFEYDNEDSWTVTHDVWLTPDEICILVADLTELDY